MNSGEFDLLLDVWGRGHKSPFWNTEKLHSDLLSFEKLTKSRRAVKSDFLYRAYIPCGQQMRSLNYRGFFVVETAKTKPLASWSASLEGAMDFISNREKWVIIKKPISSLNVFFSLAEYWKETKGKGLDGTHNPDAIPSHQWFNEIIISMPDRLVVNEIDVVATCYQLSYPAWQEVA